MVALRQYGSVPEWEAYSLLEMSVIPVRHESKRPHYRWSRLRYVKLWRLLDDDSGYRTLEKMHAIGGGGMAALCGRPSENLLVLDCDTQDALRRCQHALKAQGVDAPTVLTNRGGHLYLRCREGAVKSTAFDGGDLKGSGGLVIMPPTRHPAGGVYRWQDGMPRMIPTVSVNDLTFLGVSLDISSTSSKRLHDDTRDYLTCGHLISEGSRNNRLYDAARDYRFVGMSVDDALADLVPVAVASGLDQDKAEATVRSPYRNNRGRVADGRMTIHRKLMQLADVYGWEGRTGRTDRRVFMALVERRKMDAHRLGGGVFRAAYREIALLAGYKSISTIGRALERLTDAGLIRRAGADADTTASLWQFTEKTLNLCTFFWTAKKNIKQQSSVRSTYCSFPQRFIQHVIGTAGYQVLSALQSMTMPASHRQVAFAAGVHPTTASRHLADLTDAGLARQVRGGWVATENPQALRTLTRQASIQQDEIVAQFELEQALFAVEPLVKYLWHAQPRLTDTTSITREELTS